MIKYLKKEEISALRARVWSVAQEVNVLDVYEGQQQRAGAQTFIVCPECGQLKMSVSKTTPNKGHCFFCNATANGVRIASLVYGKEEYDIAEELAVSRGVITQDEFDFLLRIEKKDHPVKSIPKNITPKAEEKAREYSYLAPAEERNLVYSCMMEMSAFALTDSCQKYLIQRGVSDMQDFFCYHKEFDLGELISRIRGKDPSFTSKRFYGIPGFYFEFSDKQKQHGHWRFVSPRPMCVGLLIRDADGNIVGLQIRNGSKNWNGPRYTWISSAPKNREGNNGFGSSPGSPPHVFFPEKIESGSYLITEGVFKVRKLCEIYHGVGISLQGMTNSKLVPDEIEKSFQSRILRERLRGRYKLTFNFFFDADMLAKYQVYQAAKTCYTYLQASRPQTQKYVHVWLKHLGKGFDDLVYQNPEDWESQIHTLSADDFFQTVDSLIEKLLGSPEFSQYDIAEILGNKDLNYAFHKKLYQGFWIGLTR